MGIEQNVPDDQLREFSDTFTEFKGTDLFWGHGVWEKVPQEKRFDTIEHLLKIVTRLELPVICGMVDKTRLADTNFSSSNPLAVAFKVCARGIERWMSERTTPVDLCLFIQDDREDRRLKAGLKTAFRELRPKLKPPDWNLGKLHHIHDEMYFGDSKESIGLQLADLCSFLIFRHYTAERCADSEGFYKTIKPYIFYKEIEPKIS
jgi:hypothetical protein